MKSVILNRNSYHFLLAQRGGFCEHMHQHYGTNFCDYTQTVLKGAFSSFLVLALISFAALCAIQVLLGIGFSIYYGMFIFSHFALFVLTVVIGLSILIVGAYGIHCYKEHLRKKSQDQKSDNFISKAYHSWQNKYCVQLEFSDQVTNKENKDEN